MRLSAIEIALLCGIAVRSLLLLGLVSVETLVELGAFLLVWGVATTLLVGSAGAWVAIARRLRARDGAARAEAR